ncbi:hypothetical protein [Arenicella xantha]|nr:hypothetical protein [Arenicella xantha]
MKNQRPPKFIRQPSAFHERRAFSGIKHPQQNQTTNTLTQGLG